MNKNFIFFLFAVIILLLSVVVWNTGPIINKKVGKDWNILNCLSISDDIELEEEKYAVVDADIKKKDIALKKLKNKRNSCNRKKAMYGLEYSAFTLDVIVGFICSILGFLHYLDEGKSFAPKSGLIGLIFGAISTIITLIYFIYSILVFSNDSNGDLKTDEKNAYAKWDSTEGSYLCLYYEEDNDDGKYAKYSELGKKQYNYNKDIYEDYQYNLNSEIKKCNHDFDEDNDCIISNKVTSISGEIPGCSLIYQEPEKEITNSNLYNLWLTTIILSVIIFICNIGVAIFGYLLFKNKENSGEVKIA